jgi:drug/metabolite transporter (DMT)-like permease
MLTDIRSFACLLLYPYRYNYPNFLILFVNFMYIPICFAYLLPSAHFGWFHQTVPAIEHWWSIVSSRRSLIVMGFLDGMASCIQILSAVHLPGPLVVLLPQAVIPMSMLLSNCLLHERFHHCQVIGAVVVVLGILVVLEPVVTQRLSPDYYCQALSNLENGRGEDACSICKVENSQDSCLSHVFNYDDDAIVVLQQQRHHESIITGTADGYSNNNNTFNNNLLCDWVPFEDATREEEFLMLVWSLVLIASCIPLTLSTVYKQMALGTDDESMRQQPPFLDPIFLSGWISVYQFLFSVPVAISSGLVSSPPVPPTDLMQNLWNGLRCYALGMSFIKSGCHIDDLCSGSATFYVNLSLVINIGYTITMILVVKYGSMVLLFAALTIMVPSTWTLIPLSMHVRDEWKQYSELTTRFVF